MGFSLSRMLVWQPNQRSYDKLKYGLIGGLGEWLNPPDCKSGARKGYVGSNPTPSTIGSCPFLSDLKYREIKTVL